MYIMLNMDNSFCRTSVFTHECNTRYWYGNSAVRHMRVLSKRLDVSLKFFHRRIAPSLYRPDRPDPRIRHSDVVVSVYWIQSLVIVTIFEGHGWWRAICKYKCWYLRNSAR